LTLHRLGLVPTLGISLKTTNCLESLNAQLDQLIDKMDRWQTTEQKHRWVASVLLLIEPRVHASLQGKIGKAECVVETRIA
jgi:hypothetical protein